MDSLSPTFRRLVSKEDDDNRVVVQQCCSSGAELTSCHTRVVSLTTLDLNSGGSCSVDTAYGNESSPSHVTSVDVPKPDCSSKSQYERSFQLFRGRRLGVKKHEVDVKCHPCQ